MTNGWSDIIDLKKAVTHKSSSSGSGAVTEADPAARIEGEKNEYRLGIVDDAFAEAKQQAKINPHGNAFKVDTGADDSPDFFTTPEHAAEKSFAAGNRPSLIPMGMKPDPASPRGFVWVLTPTDNEAILQGYYCENCLQLQADRGSYSMLGQCKWAHGRRSDNTGCGWNAMHKRFA